MISTLLHAARKTLADVALQYAAEHAALIAQREEDREAATADGKRPRKKTLPPIALECTLGTGKSHTFAKVLADMDARGLPCALIVPTRQLAEEARAAAKAEGVRAVVWTPRRAADNEEDKGRMVGNDPFACYQLTQVRGAGEQNHRPATSMCKQCPNGHKMALRSANIDRAGAASEFFRRHTLDPSSYAACQYLYVGLPAQLKEKILILTPDAFSDAVATYIEDSDDGFDVIEKKTQRLMLVDESVALSQEVEITAGQVEVWRNRLPTAADALQKTALLMPFGDKERDIVLKQSHFIRDEADKFTSEVLAAIAAKKLPGAERVAEFAKGIRNLKLLKASGAPWERLHYIADNEYLMPLRAISALALSIDAKTARYSKDSNSICAFETSPILTHAAKKGSTILADATLSDAVKDIVAAAGGETLDISVPLNLHITHVTGKMYQRGKVAKKTYGRDADDRKKQLKKLATYMQNRMVGDDLAIVTHRATYAYTYKDNKTQKVETEDCIIDLSGICDCEFGWFGMHEKGHNRWSGYDVAAVGMPLISEQAFSKLYAEARACVLALAPEAAEKWPAYDGTKTTGTFPPLPAQPEVRRWLLHKYAESLVQLAGRSRSVMRLDHDPQLRFWIWGGIDCYEMHAVLAEKFRQEIHIVTNPVHVTRGAHADMKAQRDATALVSEAVEMCRAANVEITRRNVAEALRSTGIPLSEGKVSEELAKLRGNGAIPVSRAGRKPAKNPK